MFFTRFYELMRMKSELHRAIDVEKAGWHILSKNLVDNPLNSYPDLLLKFSFYSTMWPQRPRLQRLVGPRYYHSTSVSLLSLTTFHTTNGFNMPQHPLLVLVQHEQSLSTSRHRQRLPIRIMPTLNPQIRQGCYGGVVRVETKRLSSLHYVSLYVYAPQER